MGNNKLGYLNLDLKIVLPYEEYKYYVYRHVRLDNNSVFYIGYGKTSNGYPARAIKESSRNKEWYNITHNTVWESEIIFQSNDFNIILEKEIEFIKVYGLKDEGGSLCNRTTGGNKGFKITETKKKEMSKNFKEYWSEREHHFKGIPKSKEHRKKLSESSYLKKEITCETMNKTYNSMKECIIDIFGEFKKSHENGIRNNLKKGLEYKGYKFNYKYKKNAQ